MSETKPQGNKNEKVGTVVSTKMAKTIIIEVTRRVQHPLYKRIINKRKKFYAHDEDGKAKMGDVVRISTPKLGTLVNRVTTSKAAPPWHFGARALMRNLASRGLLNGIGRVEEASR